MPTEDFTEIYGERQRPALYGPVRIVTSIVYIRNDMPVERTHMVSGYIYPTSTTDRPSAPEPKSGVRVGVTSKPSQAALSLSAYNTGIVDMDKGHILALELGGPDVSKNIVPQYSQFQRNGMWRQFETAALNAAKANAKIGFIEFNCVVGYLNKQPVKRSDGTLFHNLSWRNATMPVAFMIQLWGQPFDKTKPRVNMGRWVIEQAQDLTDDLMLLRMLHEEGEIEDDDYDDLSVTKGKLNFKKQKLDGQKKKVKQQAAMYAPNPPKLLPPDNGPTAMGNATVHKSFAQIIALNANVNRQTFLQAASTKAMLVEANSMMDEKERTADPRKRAAKPSTGTAAAGTAAAAATAAAATAAPRVDPMTAAGLAAANKSGPPKK